MEEKVILVDTNDVPLGEMEKIEAHRKGLLHRAFSVFVMNCKGEILLQKRALHKYHSPGLWTNTCCSHQRLGETNIQAGKRRLKEEMGIETDLKELFSFVYKASFENGLTEHELDYVLIGYSNENPTINLDEVADFKWFTPEVIQQKITENPQDFTVWFRIIFDQFFAYINEGKGK